MSKDFRPYKSTHEVTQNYTAGLTALRTGHLNEAVKVLSAEPETSPCYGLAIGNVALSLNRLTRFADAEVFARKATTVLRQCGSPHPPSEIQFWRNFAEAVAGQGRRVEALSIFRQMEEVADSLASKYPDAATEVELEKAHGLNSWGGTALYLNDYEEALRILNRARVIYRKHAAENSVGVVEVLTNCGHAYRFIGKKHEAELALIEAFEILRKDGPSDQLFRTQLVLIQLGSHFIDEASASIIIIESIDFAERQGQIGTAYLRLAIAADLATRQGKFVEALSAISRARSLEPRLDPYDPNLPNLRTMEAKLKIVLSSTEAEVVEILVDGAYQWYRRLEPKLVHGDVLVTTSSMHEHFRLLARVLLNGGRVEESLCAFEAGRALGYAMEVDPTLLPRLASLNPFSFEGSNVEIKNLKNAQAALGPDEILLSFALLDNEIVSYLISAYSVCVTTVEFPDWLSGNPALFTAIRKIPIGLGSGLGLSAFPNLLLSLAKNLAAEIGLRKIVVLFPNSVLHSVPWRSLFRECGLKWPQLAYQIKFGLFLHSESPNSTRRSPESWIAMGHGRAGSIDLNDEAKVFSDTLIPVGSVVANCGRQDVLLALSLRSSVLISCHGSVRSNYFGGDLVIELRDGSFQLSEVLPDLVKSNFVILSACDSGVYEMKFSDYPIGAAPELIRRGVGACIGARFPVGARFAKSLFTELAIQLNEQQQMPMAFASALEIMESAGANRWTDLACFELISGIENS